MTPLRATLRFFLLAVAVALSSCIDGREEVWLEPDGSGRAEISYTLPAAAARMHAGEAGFRAMITGFLQNTPEITSSSCDVATVENELHVTIRASFDSALDLKHIAEGHSLDKLPSAASHLAGQVTAEIHGRTLEFSRTISPGKALPGSVFMPAAQFEGRHLVYIMHLPGVANDSNATRVEDSGRTLIWEMPLDESLKSPIITRFRMDIPIPWMLVTAVALPISLVGGFAIIRLRKCRNRGSGLVAASMESL